MEHEHEYEDDLLFLRNVKLLELQPKQAGFVVDEFFASMFSDEIEANCCSPDWNYGKPLMR